MQIINHITTSKWAIAIFENKNTHSNSKTISRYIFNGSNKLTRIIFIFFFEKNGKTN